MKKILLAFLLLLTVSSNASNGNDKLESVEKTHYESGKLKSETTYKNGKKEGVEKTYYDTGKLKSVKILKNETTEMK